MQVITRETGTVATLSIIDHKSGVDWINDLIGNADNFEYFDRELDAGGNETGRWIADAQTIEWWQDYIAGHEAVDDAIEAYSADADDAGLDWAQVQADLDYINTEIGNADMETEGDAARVAIETVRKERGLE